MAKVLLIEDMKGVRDSINLVLKLGGHEVTSAVNGKEGLSMLNKDQFDLVITDILMPEMDGSEVISAVTSRSPRPQVLAISGGGSNVPVEQALSMANANADAVLKKPFSKEELEGAIGKLLAA